MDLLQNGEALIKYGERGDKLYLIRYGKVRILRPDDSAPGGRVEVAKLGRGNLVGERTVVTGMSYSLLHTNLYKCVICFVAFSPDVYIIINVIRYIQSVQGYNMVSFCCHYRYVLSLYYHQQAEVVSVRTHFCMQSFQIHVMPPTIAVIGLTG